VVCDDPVAAQYAPPEEGVRAKLKIAAVLETGDEWYGVAVKQGNKEVSTSSTGHRSGPEEGHRQQLRKKWIGN